MNDPLEKELAEARRQNPSDTHDARMRALFRPRRPRQPRGVQIAFGSAFAAALVVVIAALLAPYESRLEQREPLQRTALAVYYLAENESTGAARADTVHYGEMESGDVRVYVVERVERQPEGNSQ